MRIWSPYSTGMTIWPSIVRPILLSSKRRSVSIVMTISRLLGITTGRSERSEGQTGVKIKASTCGCTIGPPAESEWPVEPVGVATISPSALKSIIFF